jgi:hypothetical protein
LSLDLSLPCRLIILNVQLGPAKSATTLEALVAEAIGLERDTTRSLADFFALPEPVIGDVVHSLWNGGWIWVDFDSGRVGLTERAQERAWDPANDPGARTERREYLYEPLSQLVFSVKEGTRRPHRDHLEVPADAEARLTIKDTAPLELRGAVQRLMLEEELAGSDSVVLSVLPAGSGEQQDAGLRWVPLQVGVATNPTTDRVFIRAADPTSTWPARAVARLSDRLADYTDRWPQSRFATQLRGRATERLERFPGAERLLRRLTDDIRKPIKEDKIAAWRDRQNGLADSARSINQHLDTLSLMRARADLLTNAPARLTALRSVIEQAGRQLIVVCPAVRHAGLQTLADAGLTAALQRNVQLVLIWGSAGGDALPAPVAAQLAAWRNRYPEQLAVPRSAAHTAANLVIADDRAALVGSGDLLDTRENNLAAAWIRSPDSGPGARAPQAVLELLAWSRTHCPDWVLAQSILNGTELSDHSGEAVTAARDTRFPEIPPNADPSMIPIWRESWSEYRNMLAEAVRADLGEEPVVELLLDGEIGEVIADQVAEATRRLAFADETTDTQPLRYALLDAVEDKRMAELAVQVDCPPLPDERAAPSFALIPNTFRPPGPARGRMVVADHQVTLGSCPVLTAPRNTSEARRSQVALRIRSRTLADEMADWLGLPATDEPVDDEAAAGPDRRGARDALTLAQGAQLARRDRDALDVYLHGILDEHDDPWAVVDRLQEGGADERLLACAVATVLQRGHASERQRKWAGWLVGHLWGRGSFVAAALLGDLLLQGPETMPAGACVLAAAIEHAPLRFDPAGITVDLADRSDAWAHTVPARAAGAAGLLADYLLGGDAASAECIDLLAKSLPPTWKELASTVVPLYRGVEGPMPVLDAARLLDHGAGLAARREEWETVAKETEKLIALHTRFDFRPGKVLYRRITAEDGIFTRLHRAAESGDPQLQREVADELPRKVVEYFDAIVTAGNARPIQWGHHRPFLDKVEQVFRTARTAATRDVPNTAEQHATPLRPADQDAAGWLSGAWDGLRAEASALPAPYHLPLQALLDRLRPLVAWQEARR